MTKSKAKHISFSNIVLFSILFIEFAFLCFQTFHQSLQSDENEHLYSAYMIFKGLAPYTDFFEHHNPLMWYLTAPLYFIFENDIGIYYLLRFLMLTGVLLTGYFVYKISNTLNLPTFFCLFSVCIYFGFDITKITGIQIRPDTLMALLSTAGFYYILTYLQTKKRRHLFVSFFCYYVSFWLLQKSAALILPAIIILFIKKVPLKDIIYASFLPIILSILYLFYLYLTDTLNLYYIYNYTGNFINTRTNSFFERNTYVFTYKNITILACLIFSIIATCLGIKNKDKYLSILSIYTILSFLFITHILYASDMHYMLPLLPLFSVIIAKLLNKLCSNKNSPLPNILISVFVIYQIFLNYNLLTNRPKDFHPFSYYMKINKYITSNTNKDDFVLIKSKLTGLKKQADGYYHFERQDIVKTVHNLIPYKNLDQKIDYIIQNKPKIIYDDILYVDFIAKEYKIVKIDGTDILFYIRKD